MPEGQLWTSISRKVAWGRECHSGRQFVRENRGNLLRKISFLAIKINVKSNFNVTLT